MSTVNAASAARPTDAAGPYHFDRPTIAEAREAVTRLYGGAAADRWKVLLGKAGLTGNETDDASFDQLLATMLAADPVTSLCARSLAIRQATYHHLSTVHTIIRGAE